MDHNRFKQQKIFEAELARQGELAKAQAQLLRDLADPVWQFQLLALQVSYDANSKEKYEAALASYDEQSWQHLKKIRAIVGGARWFTSEPAYRVLTEFIDGWLLHEVDTEVMNRRRRSDSPNWSSFNQ
jgi:hypothetical protein